MTDLYDNSTEKQYIFYISFQLMNDSMFIQEKKLLEESLHDLFGESFSKIYEDELNAYENQLAYSVGPLAVYDDYSKREQFNKIKTLFSKTHRYLPFFTQKSGVL